jgi:1,4-dihydroxy-2-naphthoyl-CoA hydrolase
LTYAIDLDDPAIREEALRRINETSGELNKAVGITFTDIGPGRLVATMPVDGNRQPFGLLHGGASCVLAESLGSVAAGLHAGPEAVPVGVDINATHHRSVREGLVTGVCTPLHEGRSTATYEIVISDAGGRRLCTARITCQLLRRKG